MTTRVIFNQTPGPLPITQTFTPFGNMQMYLEISGSVWSETPNTIIGIQASIDGNLAGLPANIFSNGNSTHRAVVPVNIPVQFDGQEPCTITLSASTPTTNSDGNDFYTVIIHT